MSEPHPDYDPDLDDPDDHTTGFETPDDAAEMGAWVDEEPADKE